jgi:hypothetical protein
MSFARAFCGWIKARQVAGRAAEETVRQILNWKNGDGQEALGGGSAMGGKGGRARAHAQLAQ